MIDSLPPNSHTQDAIANDEELARAAVEAAGGKLPDAKGSKNPPLKYWTQTDSMLAQLIMEMRQLNALTQKINSKKNAPTPKIIPVPVPVTAFQRVMEAARTELRLVKHQSLVRRLLGSRAKQK